MKVSKINKKAFVTIEIVIIGSIVVLFTLGMFSTIMNSVKNNSDTAVTEMNLSESIVGQQIVGYVPNTSGSINTDIWDDNNFDNNLGQIGGSVEIAEIFVNGGSNFEFYTGEVLNVGLSFAPSNATVSDIAWRVRSGGENISVVRDRNTNGKSASVTGLKAGTAVLEVKATDTSAEMKYVYLTIKQHANDIVLKRNGNIINDNANIGTFNNGDSFTIDATVMPLDTTDKKVIWNKGNAGIGTECIIMTPDGASVTVNIIRACNGRTVEIYAETNDGGHIRSFKFKIN